MAFDAMLCEHSDCGSPVLAKGLCGKHYARLRRIGSLELPGPKVCAVDGCGLPYLALGFCSKHYCRNKYNGGPHVLKGRGSERRPGIVSYEGVHARVKRDRGPAAQYPCFECLAPAADWAYDNADPDELYHETRYACAYSMDEDHYVPMCRPCHAAFDAAHRAMGGKSWPTTQRLSPT